MTLAYACDDNYATLTAISAVSALKHNPGAQIALFGCNLGRSSIDIVRSRVQEAGGSFSYFDVTARIARVRETGTSGYVSYAAYARLFVPEFLTGCKRVVYLDCDTLVSGHLGELVDMDMRGNPIGLGLDCIPAAYSRFIGHSESLPYYNSGVMLVDVDVWRRNRCAERLLEELAHPRGPNPLADQDAIVRCFPDETVALAPRWNFLSQFFLLSFQGWRGVIGRNINVPCSAAEYNAARTSAAIYHFSGHTLGRPWYTSSRHPMRTAYRQAASNAGMAEFAEQTRPMLRDYVVQYMLYKALPQPVFDVVCRWLYRINIRHGYGV